jgi:hypothetical protein
LRAVFAQVLPCLQQLLLFRFECDPELLLPLFHLWTWPGDALWMQHDCLSRF